jgi:hypothetical protein
VPGSAGRDQCLTRVGRPEMSLPEAGHNDPRPVGFRSLPDASGQPEDIQ